MYSSALARLTTDHGNSLSLPSLIIFTLLSHSLLHLPCGDLIISASRPVSVCIVLTSVCCGGKLCACASATPHASQLAREPSKRPSLPPLLGTILPRRPWPRLCQIFKTSRYLLPTKAAHHLTTSPSLARKLGFAVSLALRRRLTKAAQTPLQPTRRPSPAPPPIPQSPRPSPAMPPNANRIPIPRSSRGDQEVIARELMRPPKYGGRSKRDQLGSIDESWGPLPNSHERVGLFQAPIEPPSPSATPVQDSPAQAYYTQATPYLTTGASQPTPRATSSSQPPHPQDGSSGQAMR